ncbi:nuclear ribonucleoprotein [Candidatus Caldarchaeum subterraneum]|uniref:Nuclear ribonucleoprotein n=1 Tax=Caldiarchaeum subterraneum TaxID=311458 RepID=E6N696_CALS0|nr:nuclear ribonucleoprotein [Candidatus Caldarchaeum subterraneum]BAJ50683.1 nuclear ribonucleoprotein [Candidatus Caldarchaeum subterraneum]
MSSAVASKRFSDEFALIMDRVVKVVTSSGVYTGRVLAYNPNDYSLWLADAKEESGNVYSKIFLAGAGIIRIEVLETGPDMSALVERLNRLFPNLVVYHKESDTIVVMDRIRVSREGVFGEGPAAERVRKVYEEFMREQKAKPV